MVEFFMIPPSGRFHEATHITTTMTCAVHLWEIPETEHPDLWKGTEAYVLKPVPNPLSKVRASRCVPYSCKRTDAIRGNYDCTPNQPQDASP